MTSLPARLAAAIVARYPRAWRARYADEVLALVEDGGAGWRDVFDLARNAVTEWRLSLTSPDEHFRVSGFILRATPVVQAVLLAMTFHVLAKLIVPFIDGPVAISLRWILVAVAYLILFVLVGRILVLGPLTLEWIASLAARQSPRFRPYSRRETTIWIALLFVSSVCAASARWPSSGDPTISVVTTVFFVPLLANSGRGAEKRHAYGVIRLARQNLRITSWLVAGLEGIRVDSPRGPALARLQADVVSFTARIDEARSRLSELSQRHGPGIASGQQS